MPSYVCACHVRHPHHTLKKYVATTTDRTDITDRLPSPSRTSVLMPCGTVRDKTICDNYRDGDGATPFQPLATRIRRRIAGRTERDGGDQDGTRP
jgi:hypothetical protein